MTPPKIGVVLPTRGLLLQGTDPIAAPHILELARQAEEIGVDSLWVGDSLVAKPRLEPLTTLAAVATHTSRVTIGTAVLLAALRHPILLAQTAATVDLLSQGRLVLAMGVGGAFTPGQQQEWRSTGIDLATRASRLAEVVQMTQKLWEGERVTFQGRHFSLDGVSLGFRPHQRPRIPVLLACHAGSGRARQYKRAARLGDGMISITDSASEFGDVRKRVLHEVQSLGRDPGTFRAVYYMTVNMNHDIDAARQEADAWVKAYYGLNWWGDRWGPYGTPGAVVARVREFAMAGADEVILRFASYDQRRHLGLLAAEVLPALRH